MQGKILSFTSGKKVNKVVYTKNINQEGVDIYKKITEEIDKSPSENFNTIFQSLLGHALVHAELANKKIGEKEIKARKAVDMPDFKSYKIVSFKISGDAETEGVEFKLEKTTTSGTVYKIPLPKLFFAAGVYPYELEIAQDLDNLMTEVRSYIDGENYRKDLFSQGDDDQEKEEIDQEEF